MAGEAIASSGCSRTRTTSFSANASQVLNVECMLTLMTCLTKSQSHCSGNYQ